MANAINDAQKNPFYLLICRTKSSCGRDDAISLSISIEECRVILMILMIFIFIMFKTIYQCSIYEGFPIGHILDINKGI